MSLKEILDKIFSSFRKKEEASSALKVLSANDQVPAVDEKHTEPVSVAAPLAVVTVASLPAVDYTPAVDELLRRVDATKLYPPFYKKLRLLLENCYKRGQQYYITSCVRTVEEQNKLYAIGRTRVCDKCKAKGKTIVDCAPARHYVTKAKGGSSYHNYAIAFDGCHDLDLVKPGLQPDYTAKSYYIWAEEAEKLGLEAGYFWTSFKDVPHVQLPIKKQGITLSKLLFLYEHGGYPAVFEYLDKFNW